MFSTVCKLISRETGSAIKTPAALALNWNNNSKSSRRSYHAEMHQNKQLPMFFGPEQKIQSQPKVVSSPKVTTNPIMQAYPRVCLQDVPTKLGVSGLQPHVPVTFKLTTHDHKGVEFSSIGYYFTDGTGKVNLNKFESFGGSYCGVFPAGLLTTLEPPVEHAYRRITCTNTSAPTKLVLSVHEGHRPKQECVEPLRQVELERHFLAPGVKRIEVEEGRLRGALYIPPGPGPHPAVIDMFGASTIISEHRSALLASRGILSLALPFFGYRDLPKTLKSLEMEYFEEAVEYLLSSPTAIPDRCGVIATCQGGAIGIAMGVYIDKVKAVFSINANTCPYETTLFKNGSPLLKGHKLSSDDMVFDEQHRGKINWEVAKDKFMTVDGRGTIPIEQASLDTDFFLAAGEDCSLLSTKALDIYSQRMLKNGNSNFQTKVYPNAGHILEPPYGPFIYQNYQQYFPYKSASHTVPKVGCYFAWGGTPEGNCAAQEQLWQDVQEYVWNEVQGKSAWYQTYLTDTTQMRANGH